MSKRHEWESLSEQAQFKMICGCVCKAAHKRGVKIDPCELSGDTWLRVQDKLDADKDLLLIVMDAAEMALQKALRHDKKYLDADDYDVKGADGEALGSILDLIEGAGSVEAEAVTRVDFSVFYAALDATNKSIVNAKAVGLTQERIAPLVHISQSAVSSRLRRMRTALAACMD